jgi:hypothetical protein
MDRTDFRSGLQTRLTVLATRIADLRQKTSRATDHERSVEFGEIDELQGRYKALRERLQILDQEGAGASSGMKMEIETMADDLAGTVDDFMMRIDAAFQSAPAEKGAG